MNRQKINLLTLQKIIPIARRLGALGDGPTKKLWSVLFLIPVVVGASSTTACNMFASTTTPTTDERITLITCWPYTSNTHRLIIVAKPIEPEKSNKPIEP